MGDSEELRRVAIHEAGHVLARLDGKLPWDWVTVDPAKASGVLQGSSGLVKVDPRQMAGPLEKEPVEAEIVAYMAGNAANQRFDEDWAQSDAGLRAASQDEAEVEHLVRLLIEHCSPGECAEDVTTKLLQRTRRFIAGKVSELDALAKALVEKKTLYPRDVRAILSRLD